MDKNVIRIGNKFKIRTMDETNIYKVNRNFTNVNLLSVVHPSSVMPTNVPHYISLLTYRGCRRDNTYVELAPF